MRIVHVFRDMFPPLAAGITGYMHDVAGETVARGHEVLVHTAGVRSTRQERLSNGVVVHRFAEHGRPLSCPASPALVRRTRSVKADLVHLHMPCPTSELGAFMLAPRVPVVVSFHAQLGRHRFMEPVYGPFRQALLNRVSTVLVSCPAMAGSPELATVQGKVEVLPYGVSPRLAPPASPADTPAQPVPRADESRLLFVGRLVYYKGVDVLIRAVAASAAPVKLTVVGDGPMRAELQELAADLGVGGSVQFKGLLDDEGLRHEYAAHDAFVLPSVSHAEAFGLAMSEAMANGLPVVSTELHTGTSWVNMDGVTGLVVPPGDVAALAGAFQRLRKPSFRAELSAGAQARAREQFDFTNHCNRLIEVYERVARVTVG